MPMGMPPPGMGASNPQNLEALAAAGDPRAIAALQQQAQALRAQAGGGMSPGAAPPGAGGGMPPPGAPPPGMPPAGPPQGGMPMSQAQFSGYGNGPNPDAQARKAAMLEQILRARAMQMQGGQ